jgi:putative oxidoreductase
VNIVLWILQVVLAVIYLLHGWLLLFPPASMIAQMNEALQPNFRMFIGITELCAAVGLTLPGITRILPLMIPLASAGLMIVMASATVFHLYRGEVSSAIVTIVLFGLVTFVAYARWKVLPILSRQPVHASAR